MPTSPQTSIFAAVTQALPGPTMRSTGEIPASGRPYASAPMAWAPPATTNASTSRRPAAPSRTGWVAPSRSAGEATTIRSTPATVRRDDGHHQRRRVRGGPAGDVRADGGQRRPAPLDLDARGRRSCGSTPGAGSRRSGGRARSPGRARAGRWASGRPWRLGGRRGRGRAGHRVGRRRRARWPPGPRRRRAPGRRRASPGRHRGSARPGAAPRRVSARRAAIAVASPRRTSARSRRSRRSATVLTGRSSRWGGRGSRTPPPP